MKKIVFIFLMVIFFSLNVFGQENKWFDVIKKIKPLETTEKEVEKLLGTAKERYSDVGEYDLAGGTVFVTYSTGMCDEQKNITQTSSSFNVEKGVVINLNFSPESETEVASLGLDLSNLPFEKTKDVSPLLLTYHNENDRISIVVQKDLVKDIRIYPPKKLWHLGCQEIMGRTAKSGNTKLTIKDEKCVFPFQIYHSTEGKKLSSLLLFLESKYFTPKSLKGFFTCLSEKYQKPEFLFIKVFSNKKNIEAELRYYSSPPFEADPPDDTSKTDCKNLKEAVRPCPTGYFRAKFQRYRRGEFFDYSPDPKKTKTIRIQLKTKKVKTD